MKLTLRNQFFIFMLIVLPQFAIGSFIGEDKGTVEHWIYWPLVISIILGCLWFFGLGIWSLIKNR